ncbi:MAG: nucleotide exchange factor GrpE [Firmicutes bacterium]|nr:nucleotide exchange factor GrpE [Bacillota bacterium]
MEEKIEQVETLGDNVIQEEKKVKEKKKKIDKEKEELKLANIELKEKVLRITAEMQNMRRRYENDIQNLYKYDGFDIAEKLLPVIDNFERAMNVKTEGNEKFLDGFKMIYEQMISILNSKGIVAIDALNKEFDPSIMNAVLTEVNNEIEENIVLDVLQKGYMYNDKLIRPAMVKVNNKESE